MRIAPGATLTRLPHGGAVLVNATTLALTECGEPEAVLIDHLLADAPGTAAEATGSRPANGPSPAAEHPPLPLLRRMAEQLIESGWLLDDRRS
ncbi:actinodefensin-associated protein B [Actinomadura sp. HBU206391]|uniref:actinodefensin-associated protein B n=1 Tax=Actinomadura sp. HBU206391 TaxID=2731692 RepID=UPI0016506FD9|nr:actinodefensin-associated protein B [Actinomadura sp. HBU206391]MBC6459921.1 actinodefensin-associated protein B [Actinomadura sp. HBU206391]